MADKTDKKTRNCLTLQEKILIYAYKEDHPQASYETIASYFTELWNKKIDKSMAFRYYKTIKAGWSFLVISDLASGY